MRQRSTLAHALAHFVFNDWADYGGGNWDRRSNGVLRADAFGQASVAWSKPGQYMQVLSDEWTDDLARAVSDVARMPMGERMKTSKDLCGDHGHRPHARRCQGGRGCHRPD